MRHSCCKSNQPRTAGRPTEPSSDLRCLNIAHDLTCRTAKIYRFLWSSAALSLLKPASSSFFFFFSTGDFCHQSLWKAAPDVFCSYSKINDCLLCDWTEKCQHLFKCIRLWFIVSHTLVYLVTFLSFFLSYIFIHQVCQSVAADQPSPVHTNCWPGHCCGSPRYHPGFCLLLVWALVLQHWCEISQGGCTQMPIKLFQI